MYLGQKLNMLQTFRTTEFIRYNDSFFLQIILKNRDSGDCLVGTD